MRYGYVYLLASRKNGTLYLGVTSDLVERVEQHKNKTNPKSFTAKYGVHTLVWFERFDSIIDAIAHEKTMKKYKRQWKINLIEENNPDWRPLILEYDD